MIVGDLADPIEGGPCYKLYTKSFYEYTVKPRLKQDGIFITQVCVRYGNEEVCEYIYIYMRLGTQVVDIYAGWSSWNFQPY